MGYAIGEIAVLRVDRIEGYGAYFKARTDDPSWVLVLVPEIAWVPTPPPSLRLSLGEEREVLVLRQVSETEYAGSLRRLEEENPYEGLLAMPSGTELRGTVEACFGGVRLFLPGSAPACPCARTVRGRLVCADGVECACTAGACGHGELVGRV